MGTMVRKALAKMAGSVGARDTLADGRDRLVDMLNGDDTGRGTRRNRIDDRHLVLLLSFALRADSNCLDVGAHVGQFLRHFPRVAPLGSHIAYEPLPDLCDELVLRFPAMDIRKRALSNREGQSTFVHVLDPGLEGYSGLKSRPYPRQVATETITVDVERLDDHLPDGWLPDFVKIDVEGAEPLVIEGAIQTLRKAKPLIAFEHGWHGSEADSDLFKLLCDDVGFRIFDMDGHGPLGMSQFHDALASGRWNWVAHE